MFRILEDKILKYNSLSLEKELGHKVFPENLIPDTAVKLKFFFETGFEKKYVVNMCHVGDDLVINIDLDNINEEMVYEAFKVDGNEAEVLNDGYLELFELIGRGAMLRLFKYFCGDKIDCPKRLYRSEFIAGLIKQETARRERAKSSRASGYMIKFIERVLSKRCRENEAENSLAILVHMGNVNWQYT